MKVIKVTGEFGVIVRKHVLIEKNIPMVALNQAMQASSPLDMNDDLISFGPHFGQEALEFFTQSLMSLGLEYFDDFIEFSITTPEWCRFYASENNTSEHYQPQPS